MPVGWDRILNELILLLAGLYPNADRTRLVLRQAGLNPEDLDLSGAPKIFWLRIVEEANRQRAIGGLLAVAKEDFPNFDFEALQQRLDRAVIGPRLSDSQWKGRSSGGGALERVIGTQPTFLPIHFLETGLLRSRAVARVETRSGLGTGFLIDGNLLITNNHVIPSSGEARTSKVRFNFQQTPAGSDCPAVELPLAPDLAFATSPEDDWTAVRVQGDPAAQWGTLELVDATVEVDDFVNIIQHPGGMAKQIALYHNMVAFADDRRIQYLTDTLPGSSGSPVFDSRWRVVALHHSGGWLPEPGTQQVFFRNEGIHVRALIMGLRESGLLA